MGDAKYLVLYYGKDQREELEGWDEIGLQRMTPLEKEYWLVKEAPSVLVVDPSGRVIFQSKGILTTKKEIKKIIQKGIVKAYRIPMRQLTNDNNETTDEIDES